jgi:hypothetical protein
MSDQSDFEFASQFVASNEIDKQGQDILKWLHGAESERRQALEQAHPAAPEEAHIGAYDEGPGLLGRLRGTVDSR